MRDDTKHFDICDEIATNFQGRSRSTSERATMMQALVNTSNLSDEVKAVLTILINHYEESH